MYDFNGLVTARDAERQLTGVSRQLIHYWKTSGNLTPAAFAGRSPLYRLGDIIDVEQKMRDSSQSRRPIAGVMRRVRAMVASGEA